MDCRLPGCSVHGVFQARVLDWVAVCSSRGSLGPRDWSHVSCIGRGFYLPQSHQGSTHILLGVRKSSRNTELKCTKRVQLKCSHTHTHRGKQVKWRTYKLNGGNNYGTAVDVRVCSAQLFGRGRHRLIRKRKHIFPALRQLIMLSRVWLFVTLWTVACQAPPSMGFSGKNTGLGCHFLLQRIFLTQESSPRLLHLLHCRQILYPEPSGKPIRWQPTGRTDDEAA